MLVQVAVPHIRLRVPVTAILLITLPVALYGQVQPGPLRELDSALRELAHAVTPSVVEVRAIVYSDNKDNDDQPPDRGGLQTVTGSGVIMDPRGYVITNAHVVEGAVSVAVNLDGCTGEKPETMNHDMTVPA